MSTKTPLFYTKTKTWRRDFTTTVELQILPQSAKENKTILKQKVVSQGLHYPLVQVSVGMLSFCIHMVLLDKSCKSSTKSIRQNYFMDISRTKFMVLFLRLFCITVKLSVKISYSTLTRKQMSSFEKIKTKPKNWQFFYTE